MHIGPVQARVGSIATVIGIRDVVVDAELAIIVHMAIRLWHMMIPT